MQVACLSSVGVRAQGSPRPAWSGVWPVISITTHTSTLKQPSPPPSPSPMADTTRTVPAVLPQPAGEDDRSRSPCFQCFHTHHTHVVSLCRCISLPCCIVVSLYLVAQLYRCFVASHRLVVSLCRCVTSDRHDCGLPRDLRRASGAGRLLCCRLGGIFGLGDGIRVRVHGKLILRRATRHLVALVWVAHLETLV